MLRFMVSEPRRPEPHQFFSVLTLGTSTPTIEKKEQSHSFLPVLIGCLVLL